MLSLPSRPPRSLPAWQRWQDQRSLPAWQRWQGQLGSSEVGELLLAQIILQRDLRVCINLNTEQTILCVNYNLVIFPSLKCVYFFKYLTQLHLHWLEIKCFIQNVTAEYRVDLELQISYACVFMRTFQCCDVRLVRIIIIYLFQIKFTIIIGSKLNY